MKGLILVADEDHSVAARLETEFVIAGFAVQRVATFGAARETCHAHPVAGIILESRLADGDGVRFCEWFRREGGAHRQRPLLLLTHRATEDDRVAALEAGADDFVAKPFNSREVFLRLRRWLHPPPHASSEPMLYPAGLGVLDVATRTLSLGPREVELTRTEFELLRVLVRQRGAVCSREALLDAIARPGEPQSLRSVDTLVRRLRRKLGTAGRAVQTVRGFGYRLPDARG
jgi:DNA-binding response OmpR family regulator